MEPYFVEDTENSENRLTAEMPVDQESDAEERMHFVVVVLGDVGRSPRMQYHAASLLVSSNFLK